MTNANGATRLAATPPAADVSQVVARLAGVGWFRVDRERTITAVSPEMEQITGFSAAEVLGKPCIALIRCGECLPGCGVFRHGRVAESTLSVFTKDGKAIEVARAGEVTRDGAGQVTGAIETVRRTDGAARRETSAQLETLLGSLGRMYVIADRSQQVMSASTSLAEMLGYAPEALVGVPLSQLMGDNHAGERGGLWPALASGARREGLAAELVARDGRSIPVSVSVGPIDSGTLCGAHGARFAVMIRPADENSHAESVAAFEGIVGRSVAMQRLFRLIEQLGDNDATVLVTGESGTGKELVARALHARSGRRGPFVAVNCAALPSELLESELFGHVRGAFSGAMRDREGRFEVADGGTLFLDEIGDMPPTLQVKLLRVLQSRTFERLGESRPRTVDVRVIAATHVDLEAAVAHGRFREDLYYRLRVVPIHVPPLRERRDDLTHLIPHLLERTGTRRGRALRLSPAALEALVTADWPGNVRELENALEYATALCDGQTIQVEHLPPGISAELRAEARNATSSLSEGDARRAWRIESARTDGGSGWDGVAISREEQDERLRIRAALQRTRYRREDAASLLGMSRTTLWRKMKEYRL